MMDAILRGTRFWERNGNIMVVRQPSTTAETTTSSSLNPTRNVDQNCTVQNTMNESNQSSQNNSCFGSDWNSNQFLSSDVKMTDQKSLDSSLFERMSNFKDNANKEYCGKSPTSPASSPTAMYGASLHQKDLSYDDLSKNIDANLAEIDMETFRSEDINSILALPAIYSGDFQSESHGEQCASVSGSLLNELELDSSTCNRHSEDEISICKDEPLFSPLREPPVPAGTISVDSLDNSSSYEQDLVLTCKANKNNYTIVFEGSSTQFSDDSDYQDVCRSSEGESSMSAAVQINCGSFRKQSSMVQSDVAFTTWSKLWKSHRVSRRKSDTSSTKISIKSQSLPNLSHNSFLITDKQLSQWAKWCGNHRLPIYEIIQNYQAASGMHMANSKEGLHSVSLLKMFMKHKVSSNSSIGSSAQSDSSTSLILQPLSFRNASLQNSLNVSEKVKPLQRMTDDHKDKIRYVKHNDNDTRQVQLVDNIQMLDWNSVQNMTENNNNNINSLYNTDNVPDNNNIDETRGNEECDNSQYFEDSLMDAPSPPLKHFHTTPIKEEEETDISSGDEVMRDSKNPFGSDDSSSGEITVIQNNSMDKAKINRQENANLDKICNILPSHKTKIEILNGYQPINKENISLKKASIPMENHSTQTKQLNNNEGFGSDGLKPLQAFNCKTSSNQTDCDTTNTVQYTTSRDSSPASSGYVSSRHSSVERARSSSLNNVNHSTAIPNSSIQKSNVVLTTTCTCGTQIPVHVKDSSVQTSTLAGSNSSSGFTFKESTTILPQPNQTSQTSVKSPVQDTGLLHSKQRSKDKKSVYVCYPNYSLPDLSFLRSVIEENSESVFLTPTEYKLPQEILNQRRPSRPRSYGAYENLIQKHLTKIKDWDSLNVLLPDDLKLLISKSRPKGIKTENSSPTDISDSKDIQQILSSSYCNMDDVSKLKNSYIDAAYKQHVPRSILRKSSSAEQCEDKHCQTHLPTRCSSASSYICGKEVKSLSADVVHYNGLPQNTNGNGFKYIETGTKNFKQTAYQQNFEKKCSPCNSYKLPSPLNLQTQDIGQLLDKKYLQTFESGKDDNLLQNFSAKNMPFLFNDVLPAFDQKNDVQTTDSQSNCLHGKKAVKFCERSPTKNSKQSDACKSERCCSCDVKNGAAGETHSPQCSCDMCRLESEKISQDFLISPTQNSLLYSDISDSYTLQNFSGGGKFFQEALRRKTGLVENLRKATQIIFEHHKVFSKKGGDNSSSLSMGQKILSWLCPAVHTIFSDGLLPSVQGFFGPLPNSPWKVAGASIKQGETRKDVEELLNTVNSEKLLTDSTYRFNAFILGLLNLGCFEWWLGHLCSCQSLICHHYHPTALLSLLALPAAVHLRHELKELVSPLSNLNFNLDIILETKLTSGDNWKKYDTGNFRPNGGDLHNHGRGTRDHEEKSSTDLNLQLSPSKQVGAHKTNDFSLKNKHSHHKTSPCNNVMNIRDAEEYNENQVWPGITINPFPNAKFAEEFSATSHGKKDKHRNGAAPNLLRDTLLPREIDQLGGRRDVPHFSLCSSTDSGCSSQIEHLNHAPAVVADESPNADVKEGQQFKMLRQKWEKISHGMSKQVANKTPPPKTPTARPTISSSSKSKKKTESSPPRASKDITTPKTPTKMLSQTPPARRAHGRVGAFSGEVKVLASDASPSTHASGKVAEKRGSLIPTLKFVKPKSMIPVQKMGSRTRSANRDM